MSLLTALCLMLTILPITALADSPDDGTARTTMTLAEFVKAVEDANYTYDGEGITVQWSPSSACTDNQANHECLFEDGSEKHPADGNNAQRIQAPNAQYQIFGGQTDVSISNVHFVFVPADYTLCMNSTWGGTATADKTPNAELQMQNTGDVTFTGCTFDKVIASPFGSTTSTVFEKCEFSNVYNAYAIKDIHSADTLVTGCTFTNCSGGIYLEGSTPKDEITITNNTFINMDTYAEAGKKFTRGLIQFSAAGDYSNAAVTISGNQSDNEAAVLRQLNPTVTAAVVDEQSLKEDNQFADSAAMLVGDTTITANKTIYINADTGNDSNAGSTDAPVKTFAKALTLANAGDTIEITGDLNHSIQGITKPLTIQGAGEDRVAVSGGVGLPVANGTVTFRNLSFNGSSTFGNYSQGSEYSGLDLVIDDCAFTQAGGNCVYIIPEIDSLTVTNCDFNSAVTSYQKQYMIWPYAAKTITITDNTFNGQGLTRAPIHLGDGHPDGTTATVSGNTISGFERGVQLALINDAENTVTISGNTFKDVTLSTGTSAESYETATVFIHETQKNNTQISYTNNKLTGNSERAVYTENAVVDTAKLFTNFSGNTLGDGENAPDLGTLEENVFDPFVAQIGQNKYKSLDAAITAAGSMSGDVIITLIADADYSNVCSNANNASNTISFDLSSATKLSSLKIQGASQDVQIISGVNGNGIDGGTDVEPHPYCPKISVKLPEGVSFTVENLTFPNDLQFDSDDGTVVVRNCMFNGSISGYPQAKSISYLNNTFDFKGTADNFYSGNAYPVWYKVTDGNKLDLIFTGNTVIGCRGVHVECRGGQANIRVDNNRFDLSDSNNLLKVVALQLVNQLNGNISFQNNYVDAYMAICFYKDLEVVDGAALAAENNYLVGDCKLYGSSEWNQDMTASDAFAQSIIDKLTGTGSTVTPGHTDHNYVDGVCTICGQSEPTSSTSYAITVESSDNGTVTASRTRANKGLTITLTVKADEGYALDTLTVTDKNGNEIKLTDKGDGKYTFTMPSSAVTVKASFAKDDTSVETGLPFTDVKADDWFYEAVKYAYDNKLMDGTSSTTFAPLMTTNRAMIVTILWRLEGSPVVNYAMNFSDVESGVWYTEAVRWAAAEGIVKGYSDTVFAPNDTVTREQLATILYRYAEYKEYDVSAKGDLTTFADGSTVSTWAADGMTWAVGAELITGKDGGKLDPTGTATRAEVATILMRFCENVAK